MSFVRRATASLIVAGTLLVASRARAEAICKGCVLVPPQADAGPRPLLVALHGDIDHADTTAAPWKPAIVARGWGLLSIECPVAEGCDKGSFWRWNGPVAWLLAEVAKVVRAHPIDRDRVYVSGWSGGASYIGWHAQEIADAFAAIVIHGGGVKPRLATCAHRTPPVYFLVGSGNPLHDRVKDLHAYFEGCHHDVVWDLLPRKGHAEELAALDRARADTILEKLETWTRKPAPVPSATTVDAVPSVVLVPSASPPGPPAPPLVAPPPPAAPSPPRAHGCTSSPGASDTGGAGAFVVALGLAIVAGAARARRAHDDGERQ